MYTLYSAFEHWTANGTSAIQVTVYYIIIKPRPCLLTCNLNQCEEIKVIELFPSSDYSDSLNHIYELN